MERKRIVKVRSLGRRHEVNRLEEQIWTLVYEQIWPVVRTARQGQQPALGECLDTDANRLVRRA